MDLIYANARSVRSNAFSLNIISFPREKIPQRPAAGKSIRDDLRSEDQLDPILALQGEILP
jgi:hypothetical protein